MIRIFHPKHGYLLVTDEAEKNSLLETGGYISENLEHEKQTEKQPIQSRQDEEVIEPVTRRGRRPRNGNINVR